MALTKDDIVKLMYNKSDLSKAQSTKVLETLLETIKGTLANGEDVLISGFGKFCVKDKDQRRGRDPQTGKDMILRSRRVVTFKCSGV
ncbi:MAG: integration host factor subunit alpha, partial [Desulfobacterales bacterium]